MFSRVLRSPHKKVSVAGNATGENLGALEKQSKILAGKFWSLKFSLKITGAKIFTGNSWNQKFSQRIPGAKNWYRKKNSGSQIFSLKKFREPKIVPKKFRKPKICH